MEEKILNAISCWTGYVYVTCRVDRSHLSQCGDQQSIFLDISILNELANNRSQAILLSNISVINRAGSMDISDDNSNNGNPMEQDENESDFEVGDILNFHTEKGSVINPQSMTFSISGEEHTLGNALRYMIIQNPEVEYCGYSIPHPSEDKLNIRIQTTENTTAIDAMRKGLEDLKSLCAKISETFYQANRDFDEQNNIP